MKKILYLVSLLTLCPLAMHAQEASSGEALGFSRIERSAIYSGMAGSGVAVTSGEAWAALRNSATIPLWESNGAIQASFQSWAPNGAGSTNLSLGGAFKVSDRIGLSAALSYDTSKDEYFSGGSTVKPNDIQGALGIGFALTSTNAVGVNVKYLRESLGNDSMGGVAADIFYTGKFGDISIAGGATNLGPKVKLGKEEYDIPTSVRLGGAYNAALGEGRSLLVALDADYFLSGNLTAALGLQYGLKDMFFVRGGYHYGSEGAVLPSFATLGLGVKYSGLTLDLSLLTANEVIGNTLTVGIGYSF